MTRTINLKLIAMLAAVTGAGVMVGMGTAHAQSSNIEDYTTEELLKICQDRRAVLFETKELIMADLTAANAELRDIKANGVGGELDRVKAELADTQKSLNTTGALYQKYFKLWQDTSMDKYRVIQVTSERDALQERIDDLPKYVEVAGHTIKTVSSNVEVRYMQLGDNYIDIAMSSRDGGDLEVHMPRSFFDAKTDGCTGDDIEFANGIVSGHIISFSSTDGEDSRVFEIEVGDGHHRLRVTGTCLGV